MGITPAIADCRYREPLLPQLARKFITILVLHSLVYVIYKQKSITILDFYK